MSMVMMPNVQNVTHAKIRLPEKGRPAEIPNENLHQALLEYLLARLMNGKTEQGSRTKRYARIDKMVSTWQQLSKEDTERKATQEKTGKSQAIHMNLPIVQTHMDDMVSFFSNVYAPVAGAFYQQTEPESQTTGKALIDKMNADAKKHKYYKELCAMLRALFKYNVGGLAVEWEEGAGTDADKGSNQVCSIDMYNFLYDPSIDDPADIPGEAEWAATVTRKNRVNLIRGEQTGRYAGVGVVMNQLESGNGNVAAFYNFPPNHAGLTAEDSTTRKGRADWGSYGVGFASDTATPLDNSHEVVTMYCWLNGQQFGLRVSETSVPKNTYSLFKFTILDAKRIIAVEIVALDDEVPTPEHPPRIPYFVGYLNQDDMGAAQRSIAELMNPFQTFGSFLLNVHISGARGAVHGLQLYDPEMVDMAEIEVGDTVGRLRSKKPGRDVRSGLMTVNGDTDNGQTMDSLSKLMGMLKEFFPAQALPSQIASMDRAVTSQVSAVLQGVNRRLHMLVRIMDDDILGPVRFEQFLNITRAQVDGVAGLTDEVIHRILGSGLSQLNREAAASALQQLLFAIIQNPKSAEQYDVIGLMNFWSSLLNINTDLTKFKLETPAAPTPTGAAPIPGAPPA